MNRPQKVHQVFAELRRALGNEIPAIELLQFAARLVDDTRKATGGGEKNIAATSFDELPLDEVFADGGWRMMARNRAYSSEHFEEDPCLAPRAEETLHRLMRSAA
jgi:hypothetical protein